MQVHVADAPVDLQVAGVEHALAQAQMVNAFRHRAPVYQRVGTAGAAGDDLQCPANAGLHVVGDSQQILHLVGGGLDGEHWQLLQCCVLSTRRLMKYSKYTSTEKGICSKFNFRLV